MRTVVGMEAERREVRMAGPRLPVAPARATEGMVNIVVVVVVVVVMRGNVKLVMIMRLLRHWSLEGFIVESTDELYDQLTNHIRMEANRIS